MNIKKISTEGSNFLTKKIDQVSTIEMLKMMNSEDKTVAIAVEHAIPQIAPLVEIIAEQINKNGRLIYMGAGTSGRIGLIDAVECPPTFGVAVDTVMCLMAGGESAFIKAVEGAEDNRNLAIEDLKSVNLSQNDVVVGIAASGRTPYVIAGIEYAKEIGCLTGCITTAKRSPLADIVDYPIEAVTGQEVISGSTRLKSGTAQKMICNMISTSVMIKLGKVYENYMIDLMATNEKLINRSYAIISEITGYSIEQAKDALKKYGSIKKVLIAYFTNVSDIELIEDTLKEVNGHIRKAIKLLKEYQ